MKKKRDSRSDPYAHPLDAKATDKPVVLGKLELGEYLAAPPTFADGKIYVRTKEKLFAFGAK